METRTENLISAEELRRALSYDPVTGVFRWIKKVTVGSIAGSTNARGYRLVHVNGVHYLAHRLAWLYVKGEWPAEVIDHINGDPSDNRFINLRACSRAENQQNRKPNSNNTTGVPGVYYCKKDEKWVARIRKNGKHIRIGAFKSKEEAGEAYLDAKKRVHEFNPTPRWQH